MLYKTNLSLIVYSLYVILIPLALSLVLLAYIVFKLFNENKYNYVDSVLMCKPIRRSQILWSRFFLIMSIVVIQSLFNFIYSLILFICLKDYTYLGAISICDLFITPFICFTALSIMILFALYFNEKVFIVSTIAFVSIFGGSSLVSRNLTNPDKLNISYANKDVSFAKIDQYNSTYLTSTIENNKYVNVSPNEYIGNYPTWTYFIPTE